MFTVMLMLFVWLQSSTVNKGDANKYKVFVNGFMSAERHKPASFPHWNNHTSDILPLTSYSYKLQEINNWDIGAAVKVKANLVHTEAAI